MASAVRRTVAIATLVLGAWLTAGMARAQSVHLQVESRDLYADLPFVLSVTAKGFAEEPAPVAPTLEIVGCTVTYLGVTPNTSRGLQIVNGRRREWREVSLVYRYRIEASAAGRYTVPALTVSQNSKTASSRAGSFDVKSIGTTTDMQVVLRLPERPVWIGETFVVQIDWLLRRDVGDHNFSVPLFDLDYVQIQVPQTNGRRTLSFPAGSRKIDLPYSQTRVTVGRAEYTRFRFDALATVNHSGPIELAPVKVAASLETGTRRDTFGFRVASRELFKVQDQPRRLSVRPLPQQGRPESFENAIGTAYSIDVQASRTVVQVGDPVDLKIRVRGDGPLEGLSLPPLDRSDGLPGDLFSVPDDSPVGELDPETGTKTFDVTVRIRSDEAREIPALAFSYFDPVAAEYRTVRSQPIALSVAGGVTVGAREVTSAMPPPAVAPAVSAVGPAAVGAVGSLVGADLSLSAGGLVGRTSWPRRAMAPILASLYVLPLMLLGVRVWQDRTRGRRGRESEFRRALKTVEAALDEGLPARDSAPRIVTAMRALARVTANESAMRSKPIEMIETRAYDPAFAGQPLPPDVTAPIRKLARRWAAGGGEQKGNGRVGLLLLVGALATGSIFAADVEPPTDPLERARQVYGAALEESDRVRRTRLFGESEQLFGDVVAGQDASPDLLSDWGNAALGAQEIGRATLAFRRALQLDPAHQRARKNLAWLRERAPAWVPRPREKGALDSLFFWHDRFSVSQRYLVGAIAFAVGMLLLAPWPTGRTRLLRRLSIPVLLLWMATTGSALLSPDSARDAVVMTDSIVLRSADSFGAPATLANPLPSGTEVRIGEVRGPWTRVTLADGTPGWLGSSTVESVLP